MSRHTSIVVMPDSYQHPIQLVGNAAKDACKALAKIVPGTEITVAYGYDRTFQYYFQVMDTDGDGLLMDVDTMNNNLGHGPMLELMTKFGVGTDADKMAVAVDLPI